MSITKIDLGKFTTKKFRQKIRVDEFIHNGNTQPYLHWHPHYEILVIVNGNYAIQSNNITVRQNTPAIFIHTPYSLHSGNAECDIPYHRIILSFDRTVPAMFTKGTMDMSAFDNANFVMAEPTILELHEICEMMRQIKRHGDDALTCALYTALAVHRIASIVESGRGKCIKTNFSYIQDLLCYVGDNLSDQLTIEKLAQKYEVGKTKLCSDFKESMGMTYKKYLTALKMTNARDMLRSGTSIVATSLEVGYSSEAHFVKAFREFFGITPGEFIRHCGL